MNRIVEGCGVQISDAIIDGARQSRETGESSDTPNQDLIKMITAGLEG